MSFFSFMSTVYTQIRLLRMEQPDLGSHCYRDHQITTIDEKADKLSHEWQWERSGSVVECLTQDRGVAEPHQCH